MKLIIISCNVKILIYDGNNISNSISNYLRNIIISKLNKYISILFYNENYSVSYYYKLL